MLGKIVGTSAELVDGKIRLQVILEIDLPSTIHFTEREEQILAGIRRGLLNKEIAADLGITQRAVKYHVTNLLEKTGTRSRKELRQGG